MFNWPCCCFLKMFRSQNLVILSLIRCFHGIIVDSFQVESYFDVENFRGNLGINNRISLLY